MLLDFAIHSVSEQLKLELQTKINLKTKPLGSLGQLEELVHHIGLIQNSLSPFINYPTILVFAGDHGIVEAGVSAYPQTVTAQMVANFLAGGAAINVFARQHQLNLLIVDAGVNADFSSHPMLINKKIAKGTASFLQQPAMSIMACEQAINAGVELMLKHHHAGCNCIGFGEMGIGNTSAAALIIHSLAGIPLAECTGRGAGLDDRQLQHKAAVLQQARDFHRGVKEPLDVLTTFGGFEIAMMAGAYLKAAELGMVIMVDGFISSAALLVAAKLHPAVLDYCIFSHVSAERGHQALLAYFNAKPLLNLGMCLGEGSAVALAFPLIQSAVLFLNEMASFAEAGVDNAMA